ncbi:MAG TPA: chemotaxis protein CheW [Pseudobacteroides sp.]|uniref:chemotaxis protein CheW n=1 Tax=Pseudobacteroides sp. TaxID=1968840 RepID=UPI002F95BF97
MAQLMEEMELDREDSQRDKFLTFSLGKEFYGVEIRYVMEIIGIQPITEVPELPHYIKGIINLRGKIIPVMDVRLRFKKEANEYNDRTCIIVIEVRDVFIGLIVDAVSDVLDISSSDIVPPPEVNANSNNKYIKGIGKVGSDVKLLLDCEKLINDDDGQLLLNI